MLTTQFELKSASLSCPPVGPIFAIWSSTEKI